MSIFSKWLALALRINVEDLQNLSPEEIREIKRIHYELSGAREERRKLLLRLGPLRLL